MKLLTAFSVTLVCILSLQSCSNNQFQGYVYDGDQPLDSVLVIVDRGDSIYTNSSGYFNVEGASESYSNYLIFFKKNYRIDTLRTFHHTGSIKSKEMFKTKEDTVRLSPIEQEMKE